MFTRLKFWILQTGEPMPLDGDGSRPMRAMNLSAALVEAGHDVVLWTADFHHTHHLHRFGTNTRLRVGDQLEVRYVRSRGYSSNIGLGRLVDHAQLGLNVRRALKAERPPDVAFVGYPPIEAAAVMATWLDERGVPFLLDVKDAWPDVLLRGAPARARPLTRAVLSPYFRLMERTFERADGITSTAQPFLEWALAQADRSQNTLDRVVPLTSRATSVDPSELESAERWWDEQGIRDDGRFRVSFVGTLHSSYDFNPLVAAAELSDVEFVICGDGSSANDLRASVSGLSNVHMPGWITMAQAEVLARRSTVALAPIAPHPDFAASVPNKFYDAMSKGLPVLTSLRGAAGDLVESRGIGRVYSPNGAPSLRDVLSELLERPSDVMEMSSRGRQVFTQEFDFEQVYGGLVGHLEAMARGDGP